MYINIYVNQSKPPLPARSPLAPPAGPVSPSPAVCSSPLPATVRHTLNAGCPWLGASASRMFRGIVVVHNPSPKYFFNSSATCCARLVRSSNMVSTTPSTASAGFSSTRDPLDCVEQLGHALQRKVLRLHRDEHPVRSDQRIQRKQIERGRTIKHNELEAVEQTRQEHPEADIRAAPQRRARGLRQSRFLWDGISQSCSSVRKLQRLLSRGRAHHYVIDTDALRIS
jgi:hypothetical protein